MTVLIDIRLLYYSLFKVNQKLSFNMGAIKAIFNDEKIKAVFLEQLKPFYRWQINKDINIYTRLSNSAV
jgi:hypothetical protein